MKAKWFPKKKSNMTKKIKLNLWTIDRKSISQLRSFFIILFFSKWTMQLARANSLPIWCGRSEGKIIARKDLFDDKNQTELVNHRQKIRIPTKIIFHNFVFQQMNNAIGQSKLFANSMRAQWRRNYCQKRLNFNKKIYQNLWTIVQKSQSQLE